MTETEHKLSQFADDTSLILGGKEKSLSEALAELDWFAKIFGLNINFSKTQVIWLGSKKYSEGVLCSGRNHTWGVTSFKLLGVNFDIDLAKLEKINFEEFFLQTKQLIKQWSQRNLSHRENNSRKDSYSATF